MGWRRGISTRETSCGKGKGAPCPASAIVTNARSVEETMVTARDAMRKEGGGREGREGRAVGGEHGGEGAAHQASLRSVLICQRPTDMTGFTSSYPLAFRACWELRSHRNP